MYKKELSIFYWFADEFSFKASSYVPSFAFGAICTSEEHMYGLEYWSIIVKVKPVPGFASSLFITDLIELDNSYLRQLEAVGLYFHYKLCSSVDFMPDV